MEHLRESMRELRAVWLGVAILVVVSAGFAAFARTSARHRDQRIEEGLSLVSEARRVSAENERVRAEQRVIEKIHAQLGRSSLPSSPTDAGGALRGRLAAAGFTGVKIDVRSIDGVGTRAIRVAAVADGSYRAFRNLLIDLDSSPVPLAVRRLTFNGTQIEIDIDVLARSPT